MKVSVEDYTFNIDDKYVEYSPLLKAMLTSAFSVDVNENGDIILDVSPFAFGSYVRFLQGEDFRMDEEAEELFDYMGHPNSLEYPLDVWKMKLRDNWIRDNFYRLELWRDPLYGLIQMPIVSECPIDVPKGWYVAGGAALWMAGKSNKYYDIDMFTTLSEKEATASLQFLNETETVEDERVPGGAYIENKYSLSVSGNSISYRNLYGYSQKAQFILRLYRSPSEIVHGFDLDCVGIIYIPAGSIPEYPYDTLWCTRRAYMSIERSTNWFDPQRASPSYPYRLIKYRQRGFHIYLPLISESDIDFRKVQRYFMLIDDTYKNMRYSEERDEITISEARSIIEQVINENEGYDGNINVGSRYLLSLIMDRLTGVNTMIPVYKKFRVLKEKKALPTLIDDPASLLILATFYNFYPSTGKAVSDYESGTHVPRILHDREPNPEYYNEHGNFVIRFNLLKWKKQNPMEQLTGTIFPTPILHIQDWYGGSPLYIGPNATSTQEE